MKSIVLLVKWIVNKARLWRILDFGFWILDFGFWILDFKKMVEYSLKKFELSRSINSWIPAFAGMTGRRRSSSQNCHNTANIHKSFRFGVSCSEVIPKDIS